MALIIKLLGAGITASGSQTILYPVPTTSLGAIVHNVRFVNTGVGSATINLYFKPNGLPTVRILDRDKSLPVGDILTVTPELTMATSDQIEVTTSAAVEYVVCGMEKT